jgi:excisionase family DNA binding protein
MSDLLTSRQVQDLLQVDRVTIYRMLNDGRLTGVKIGNQWRFLKADIDRLLGKEPIEKEPESEFSSVTDFPSDCVQMVQEIYAGILGIGAVAVTTDGDPLTEPTYSNPFCRLILSTPEGRAACQSSWRKIALKKTGNIPMGTCHAGLSYMRSEILSEEKIAAWLVSGQFRIAGYSQSLTEDELLHIAEKYNIPLSELKKAEQKIPELKTSQLEKVQEWTPRVAHTVQSILCERSDLVNRLKHIAEISTIQPRIAQK